MSEHGDLIERLMAPANWMREDREQHWKSAKGTYDRAPFESAHFIAAIVAERDGLLEAVKATLALLNQQDMPSEVQWRKVYDLSCAALAKGEGAE